MYDRALNRTVEQIGDEISGATFSELNRLVSQQPSGGMSFQGTVSEPSAVTVQSAPAVVGANNTFNATVPVAAGLSTVTVTAMDSSGNIATNQYEVTSAGNTRTFAYDANGNMISDGFRTFVWDAKNRLVSVTEGTQTSEFTYDGYDQRVTITQINASVVMSTKRCLWAGAEIVEERDSAGTGIVKRFFSAGVQIGGIPFFYARDHLGSIQEMVDMAGAIRARYRYDPWGRRSKVGGDLEADAGFTGHYFHTPSELHLSLYRAYDAALARWISEDPIGLAGGINRYAYVANNPIGWFDPLGQKGYTCKKPLHAFGGKGTRSGWDTPGNPFYHEYYCVERNGVMTCCGQDRSGNGFYSDGKATVDTYNPQNCNPIDKINTCQEDCLLDKCSSPRPTYGIGPQGTDCQEWSDDAVSDCKKACKPKKKK